MGGQVAPSSMSLPCPHRISKQICGHAQTLAATVWMGTLLQCQHFTLYRLHLPQCGVSLGKRDAGLGKHIASMYTTLYQELRLCLLCFGGAAAEDSPCWPAGCRIPGPTHSSHCRSCPVAIQSARRQCRAAGCRERSCRLPRCQQSGMRPGPLRLQS